MAMSLFTEYGCMKGIERENEINNFDCYLQVLAMSSRSWLSYYYQNRFHLTPLSYESLEFASGFSSEQCPEGIVAISTNTLRILALEKLGAVFNQVLNYFIFQLHFCP